MSLEPPRSAEPIIDGVSLVDVSITSPSPLKLALLARDPNADAVQSTLPEPTPEVMPNVRFVEDADVSPGVLTATIADIAAPDWEPPTSTPLSRPRFAITPPRAIRAIETARAATRPTAYAAPQLSGIPVAVAAGTVEHTDVSRLPYRPAPATQQSREPTPVHELPVLTEDPTAATHRTAQGRIHMHVRPVPPPPAARDGLRQVLLWGTIFLGVILLVVEVLSRTR
jgi:hypothetical protein